MKYGGEKILTILYAIYVVLYIMNDAQIINITSFLPNLAVVTVIFLSVRYEIRKAKDVKK